MVIEPTYNWGGTTSLDHYTQNHQPGDIPRSNSAQLYVLCLQLRWRLQTIWDTKIPFEIRVATENGHV